MQACTRDMRRNQEVSGHLGFCSKHYGALGLHAHTRSLKEDVLSRIHTVHDVPRQPTPVQALGPEGSALAKACKPLETALKLPAMRGARHERSCLLART